MKHKNTQIQIRYIKCVTYSCDATFSISNDDGVLRKFHKITVCVLIMDIFFKRQSIFMKYLEN